MATKVRIFDYQTSKSVVHEVESFENWGDIASQIGETSANHKYVLRSHKVTLEGPSVLPGVESQPDGVYAVYKMPGKTKAGQFDAEPDLPPTFHQSVERTQLDIIEDKLDFLIEQTGVEYLPKAERIAAAQAKAEMDEFMNYSKPEIDLGDDDDDDDFDY